MGLCESRLNLPKTVPGDPRHSPLVLIEYCGKSGFFTEALKVESLIKKLYPCASVVKKEIEGKTGVFEIKVNNQLIHSKQRGQGLVRDSDLLLKGILKETGQSNSYRNSLK